MPASAAPEAPLHAICYDVSCARERRRVDKLLKGYGFRAQKSVFECHLTRSQWTALQAALQALALKTGHVRVYRVYAQSQAVAFGAGASAAETPVFSYGV